MNHGSLAPDLEIELCDRLDQADALVADKRLHTAEPSAIHVREERALARLVFLRSLCYADDLPVPIAVHCDCHQNADAAYLTDPRVFQHDAVDGDVRIGPRQRLVAPLLDPLVDFLIELAHRARRNLRSPQRLGIQQMVQRLLYRSAHQLVNVLVYRCLVDARHQASARLCRRIPAVVAQVMFDSSEV